MKKTLLPLHLLPSLALAATATIETTPPSIIPEAFPLNRYEALWKKSPFTLSSVADEAASSQSYILGGAMRVEGEDLVTIVNRQNPSDRFIVSSKKPMKGFTLVSLQLDSDWSKTSAVITNNGENLTLKFDPELKKQMAAQQPQVPIMPQQAMIRPAPGAPTPTPGGATITPRTIQPRRIVIPSKPPVTTNENQNK